MIRIIRRLAHHRNPEWAGPLLEAGPITHMVVDEAHHSNAATYHAPHRGVARGGLKAIYSAVPFEFGLVDAIEAGVLALFDVLGIDLPVSFSAPAR